MALFDKDNKKFNKKVYDALSQLKANGDFEYNHMLAPNYYEKLTDQMTRELVINSVWYSANDIRLKQLYEIDLKALKIGNVAPDSLNYFWAQPTAQNNVRKIHSGLPQLISSKMADIIFGNGFSVKVYRDQDYTEEDEITTKRLEAIRKDNKENELLTAGAETESWGGGVAFKIAYAPPKLRNILPYAVVEIYQPDDYEPVIAYGRIIGDVFIKILEHKGITYKLKEHYGVNEVGAFIKFTLYKFVEGIGQWQECNLNEHPDTSNLVDTTFPGIYKKFSIYKPNKLPNSLFKGSKLGESDYSGCHSLFDALDETLSAVVQEFRDGKIKNFWPANLLPIDPLTHRQHLPPTLQKDFLVYQGGVGEREKPPKPEMVQGEIHSEKYISTINTLVEQICENVGLSPQTLGKTGLDSTAASEASQEMREKASNRTALRKKQGWKETLELLYELLLMMDDIREGKQPSEYHINVTFNDYKIKTIKDKLTEAAQAVDIGVWDLKKAIDYVNEDSMTEEEKIAMRVMVKIEKGMNTFTQEEAMIAQQVLNSQIEPVANDTPDIEEQRGGDNE